MALLGKSLWLKSLSGSHVVVAVDDVAAQNTMARYTMASTVLKGVLRAHLLQDSLAKHKPCVTWFPSESNIADAPSRMNTEPLDKASALRNHLPPCDWEDILRVMKLSASKTVKDFVTIANSQGIHD